MFAVNQQEWVTEYLLADEQLGNNNPHAEESNKSSGC
jgi:hypothetical protein